MRSSSMHDEISAAVGVAVAKTAPPAAVAAVTGDSLVAWVTVGYVMLQAAYLAWRWYRDWRRSDDDDRDAE